MINTGSTLRSSTNAWIIAWVLLNEETLVDWAYGRCFLLMPNCEWYQIVLKALIQHKLGNSGLKKHCWTCCICLTGEIRGFPKSPPGPPQWMLQVKCLFLSCNWCSPTLLSKLFIFWYFETRYCAICPKSTALCRGGSFVLVEIWFFPRKSFTEKSRPITLVGIVSYLDPPQFLLETCMQDFCYPRFLQKKLFFWFWFHKFCILLFGLYICNFWNLSLDLQLSSRSTLNENRTLLWEMDTNNSLEALPIARGSFF